MSDFVGGVKDASEYLNGTSIDVPTGKVTVGSDGTLTAQTQSYSLKEIICMLLAGNGVKLPNLQICLKINLGRLIPEIPAGLADLKAALEEAEAAMDEFIAHTNIDNTLARLNAQVAEFAAIANMINFCGTPVIPRAIPNVLDDAMGSFTGAGKDILDTLGTMLDSEVGGCIGTDGSFKADAFTGGLLATLGGQLSTLANIDTAILQGIMNSLNGFTTDIKNLIKFENNFSGITASGGSMFSPSTRVNTGVGMALGDMSLSQSQQYAASLQALYNSLKGYRVNGNNIFYYLLEPEMLAKLENDGSVTVPLSDRAPTYDHCGRQIGYTERNIQTVPTNSTGAPAEVIIQPGVTGLSESGAVVSNSPASTVNLGAASSTVQASGGGNVNLSAYSTTTQMLAANAVLATALATHQAQANKHIDWSVDQGGTQVHASNYTNTGNTTYTAGTNVSISGGNVISSTDTNTTYTAGANVTINGTVISSSFIDTDTNTEYTAGSGLSLSGTTFNNTLPDLTVALTGTGITSITGTYPNFTINTVEADTLDSVISRGALTTTTAVIPFYYANQAAFPNASTYHGAMAHSHSDGAMYFAHGGSWSELANSATIPSGNQIIDWTAFGAGTIHASNYIDTDTDTTYTAGTNVTIVNDVISSTFTNTNTTYTAGTGIDLNGTVFSTDSTIATKAYADAAVAVLTSGASAAFDTLVEIKNLADAGDSTLSTAINNLNHDTLSGFVANEHIDWSVDAGTNIHASNYTNTGNTTYTAGSGLTLSGTEFSNPDPDQIVVLTGSGATTISGTYPNFTIASTDTNTNTTYTAGTNVSINGSNVISSTDTNTDTTYTAGTNVSINASNVISSTDTNTDTNTTYTAGNGLTLSGTEFLMSGGYTGNFTATGDITAYSDKRLKRNIETISDPLDIVTKLRGVKFEKDGRHSTGVIAQEVEEVLPEVVHTDAEGMKSVAYGNVVGVLIEAIKDQQAQIDDLISRLPK